MGGFVEVGADLAVLVSEFKTFKSNIWRYTL